MVKITELVRDSRNGGCPAVHGVDGDLRLASGERVSAGMAIVQGYERAVRRRDAGRVRDADAP